MIIYNRTQIVKVVAKDFLPVIGRWNFRQSKKILWWKTKGGWYHNFLGEDGPYSEDHLRYDYQMVVIDGDLFHMCRHTVYYSDGSNKTTIHDTYEQAVTFAQRAAKGFVNPIIEE